ncbi:YjbE family putative metal transport protein [Phenylobacterium sp.]|uniref:YjbE family putative metal transport protein n=1 Tax=Phenylobacterium sp. TaxID=1871053 RepID=UPI0035615367
MGIFASLTGQPWAAALFGLLQVVLIDLVLAGDNAVAVGLAAAGMEDRNRRRVIVLGLGCAVVMRIGLALVALRLLALIGLLFAGGILLLWVALKMWGDLRAQSRPQAPGAVRPAKSFRQAFVQILIADLSMSLDNVLAVAGAAHGHWLVLVFGLLLSIALMGVAADMIARALNRLRWIGYVGVVIVLFVALHMMWDGYRGVVIDLHQIGPYNAAMPNWLDIHAAEVRRHGGNRS